MTAVPHISWLKRDCCRRCSTTRRWHHARGYCRPCYDFVKGKSNNPRGPRNRWSRDTDVCRQCRSDATPHKAHGLCHICYQHQYHLAHGRAEQEQTI